MFVSTGSAGIRSSKVGHVSKIICLFTRNEDKNSHYEMESLNYKRLSQMGRKGNIMDSENQSCPTDRVEEPHLIKKELTGLASKMNSKTEW